MLWNDSKAGAGMLWNDSKNFVGRQKSRPAIPAQKRKAAQRPRVAREERTIVCGMLSTAQPKKHGRMQ